MPCATLVSEVSEAPGGAPEVSPVSLEEADNGSQEFKWKSAWYAAHVVDDMDPSRPHAMSLLGRPIVLWRDLDGQWRCFLDMCPHRLVPLSEGRIDEGGNLQCSYHGWTFNAQGSCTRIPQAASEGPEAGAAASPRACATALPTRVEKGILFVWPDEHGWSEAETTPLPFTPEMLLPSFKGRGVFRDLGYGYEMLGENIVDLSHLPFAHHGIGVLNRDSGGPLPLTANSKGVLGFEGETKVDVSRSDWARFEFMAPSVMVAHRYFYDQKDAEGNAKVNVTGLYITPTTPGRSRLIVFIGSNIPFKLPVPLPQWLLHFFTNDVLDGDSFFLHAQEKAIEQLPEGGRDWRTAYYMPTTADRFVVAFRQWLDKYAGGAVGWQTVGLRHDAALASENEAPAASPTPPPPPPAAWTWAPKEAILDRHEGHTKNCYTCSRALAQFQTAQVALAALCFVILAVSAALRVSLRTRLGLTAAAAVAGGVAALLQGVIKRFKYIGYDHASK